MNEQDPKSGAIPLSFAALHDRLDMARYFIEHGDDVSANNRDGNTPLQTAAFLGRTELVKLLIEKGARLNQHNHRKESPADVVSGPWNPGLEQFCGFIAASAAATRVSTWDAPPVLLHPDTRLRVRGRLGVSRTVYFGVHLRDANGAFAGRFLTARSAHEFGSGEVFDVTLPIRDFILDPALKHMSNKLPARPFELTVESVFVTH